MDGDTSRFDYDIMGSLTIDRLLPATPDRVWRAFAAPGELASWFWPEPFQTEVSLEARQSGELRIRSESAGMGVTGKVTDIEPERLLSTSWQWDGEEQRTDVTIQLRPEEQGTRLTVRHIGFTTEEAIADHVRGWNDCLDRLDRIGLTA